MSFVKISIFLLSLLVLKVVSASWFVDITNDVFDGKLDRLVAAYGDFNADKKVDIFIIAGEGKNTSSLVNLTK